jgi:DNA-binding response OmpR family regulator
MKAQTRLLVVDDDSAICRAYAEILGAEGYDVVTAGDCAQALGAMDSLNGDAHVLLVDLGLPDGDGAEFVRKSSVTYGDRPTLFISGWTDEFWDLHDAPGRWLVMRKPIPIKRLLAAVAWLAHGGPKPPELDAAD